MQVIYLLNFYDICARISPHNTILILLLSFIFIWYVRFLIFGIVLHLLKLAMKASVITNKIFLCPKVFSDKEINFEITLLSAKTALATKQNKIGRKMQLLTNIAVFYCRFGVKTI